jgi:bifunctional DNA-binding transcriptional regulator/antitoxin component of YhaV-PrlF toxin-antitoxin module
MTAGYSGTPLAKKLGIKPGDKLYLHNAPENYYALVEPLPEGVSETVKFKDADVLHVFTNRRAELEMLLEKFFPAIKRAAAVWVSWYKKAAKQPTEITEDLIRDICLPMGFVDIKVCAVDDLWSGLKLVIRKELRK